MEFIISQYTHYFKAKNGIYLLYNSETNVFIQLSPDLYNKLSIFEHEGNVSIFNDNIRNILLKYRIIIKENERYNYYNKIKFISNLERYSYDKLILNIIPTTECNFSCPYCFETNKPKDVMSDRVIKDLCDFINKNKKTKKINLTWYGGEPLMAFKTIKKILYAFKDNINIPINSHSIITNGYLFDKNVCDFFKQFPLTDIQITLDGNEERHNKKRFTKTDHHTFETIVKNISTILNELPTTHVHVRINVDENNKSTFAEVCKELSGFKNKNLTFYPGFIRIDNCEHSDMAKPSILGNSKRNFYFNLERKGTDVNFYPIQRVKSCAAVKINTFIIGPGGEFYKCWNDIGFKERIIGYINQDTLENPSLLTKYILDGPMFEEPKCKQCFYFPICDGGCPQYRLKNTYCKGHYNLCSSYNDGTDNMNYFEKCLEEHFSKLSQNTIVHI